MWSVSETVAGGRGGSVAAMPGAPNGICGDNTAATNKNNFQKKLHMKNTRVTFFCKFVLAVGAGGGGVLGGGDLSEAAILLSALALQNNTKLISSYKKCTACVIII